MSREARGDAGRQWYHPVNLFWAALGQWFLWGTSVAIVLAWRWPDVAKAGGTIRAEYSISYGTIALIFLITGLTLSTRSLYAQSRNIRLHLHTQITSLLLYPTVMFGIVNVIRAAPHGAIDEYVLIGLMYLSCACTSVASNVTMTIAGGGSGEAATVEVVIGNLLGVFLSPLLNLMFFSAPGWHRGLPVTADGRSGTSGLPEIYRRQMMKMGLVLFVPIFVGQVVQNVFPKQTKWAATKLHLGKVSTFMLLLLMWSIFSTQFANNAFSSISPASLVLIIFINMLSYLLWSGFCVLSCRLPFIPPRLPHTTHPRNPTTSDRLAHALRLPKDQATAVCYCAAAKGLAVAILVLEVLYSGLGERDRAIMSIPFVLYQVEQQILSQLLTTVFTRWNTTPDVYFVQETSSDLELELPEVDETGDGTDVNQGDGGYGKDAIEQNEGRGSLPHRAR